MGRAKFRYARMYFISLLRRSTTEVNTPRPCDANFTHVRATGWLSLWRVRKIMESTLTLNATRRICLLSSVSTMTSWPVIITARSRQGAESSFPFESTVLCHATSRFDVYRVRGPFDVLEQRRTQPSLPLDPVHVQPIPVAA